MSIGQTANDARIQPFDWTDGTGHRNTQARLTGKAAAREKQTCVHIKTKQELDKPPTGAVVTGGARTAQGINLDQVKL